jgi:hypothetical protein
MASKKQAMKLHVYTCAPGTPTATVDLGAACTLYGEDECELKDVMTAPGYTIFDPLAKAGAAVKGMVMVCD